jgi:branched-subunit amino acid ABC-type transport system permease component
MSGSQFIELLIGGLAIGCIYSLIALGFTMIIRATGVLHFAQGELVMLGAMFGVTAHHLLPLPFIALLLVGMAFGGLAAVAIELGIYRTLRLRRIPLMNIIIATIGMSILLQNTGQLVWGSEPIAYPRLFATTAYAFGPARVAPQLLWIIGMGVLVMVSLQLFLAFTRTGRAMQAAAQRPETAQLMGINLTRITAYTYAIAGALGGGAGVLLGSLFYASFNMGFLPAIKAFVAATLGGLGSIGGAMVGGILFGLIETFAAIWVSTSYKDAVGMIILILILLAWPEGLLGLIRRGK